MVDFLEESQDESEKLSLLIFFTRHGERADQALDYSMFRRSNDIDPALTTDGKLQAIEAGRKIFSHIKKNKRLNEKYMHLVMS